MSGELKPAVASEEMTTAEDERIFNEDAAMYWNTCWTADQVCCGEAPHMYISTKFVTRWYGTRGQSLGLILHGRCGLCKAHLTSFTSNTCVRKTRDEKKNKVAPEDLKKQKRYYVVPDLEAISNTRVNGIGLVVGDSDGELHLKKEWWLKFEEKDMDPRCKAEFWDRNKSLLSYALENGGDERAQIQDFVKTYDGIADMVKVPERDLKLVSDNPEFDFGRLTPYVENHCKRQPLRYTSALAEDPHKVGIYRPITDLGDAMWYFGVDDIIENGAKSLVAHDHRPSNDAENIWIKHLMTEEFCSLVWNDIKLKRKMRSIAEKAAATVTEKVRSKRKRDCDDN